MILVKHVGAFWLDVEKKLNCNQSAASWRWQGEDPEVNEKVSKAESSLVSRVPTEEFWAKMMPLSCFVWSFLSSLVSRVPTEEWRAQMSSMITMSMWAPRRRSGRNIVWFLFIFQGKCLLGNCFLSQLWTMCWWQGITTRQCHSTLWHRKCRLYFGRLISLPAQQ